MHFTRLRLTGFKSFVDPTEFVVHPGLTGIVGPNGCGKSNLVEALRWVMGETSARSLRGGEMDDIIFNGTTERPARNIAEVSLVLDNRDRAAPAPFNETEAIEVIRRIERGEGSAYRINGREVRARDVQLLFADLASGARSAALVSQGHISDFISAKPTQRRHLLEEAAGITGLHSRRHEAELKLRAAETNLARLEDVVANLEEQLRGLKRQARQATRYRNLSDHIRRAEALLLHIEWTEIGAARNEAAERLAEAVARLTETTQAVARLSARQADEAAVVPDLRRADADAAAALQRLMVARDQLDGEERRLDAARAEIARRIEQNTVDLAREETLRRDALAASGALEDERDRLAAADTDEIAERTVRADELARIKTEVGERERALTALTRAVAADEARATSLRRRIEESEIRRRKLDERAQALRAEEARLRAVATDDEAVVAVRTEVGERRAALEAARAGADQAEAARIAAEGALKATRERARTEETAATRFRAEVAAISELLEIGDPDLFPPLIDSVAVEPGYEDALGAALGDELAAPSDEAAPMHWRTLPPLADAASLPEGTIPLARFVTGPAALARRLAAIGLVADEATGAALALSLAPGQRLVTKTGALWRWDGFTVAAGAPTAAATRLAQRNRLNAVRDQLAAVEPRVEAARRALDDAEDAHRRANETERLAREAARQCERALEGAREREAATIAKVSEARSRASAIADNLETVARDIADVDAATAAVRDELAAVPEIAPRREEIATLEAALADARAVQIERQSAFDRIAREIEMRHARLAAIANELGSWRSRADAAAGKTREIEARQNEAQAESERLAALPAEIAARRESLFEAIASAESRRRETADALITAERAVEASTRELRALEASLADAREERARREGVVEQVAQATTALVARIQERLSCQPEDALGIAEVAADQALPEKSQMQTRVERLVRERDTMGPVNLRAEIEANEIEEKLAGIQTEREDLVAAIARLRQGIAGLNREGRERLMEAFKTVDEHFQKLFTRLFGGGRAHLALTGSDDPLEAGLEIMASPPGKKLQTLTLLSGGEQALTALSLLFAVFLSNPAPVCVLDEVDAPLDDANVDRFCMLLADIAAETHTRFVLITHHRLTMARMDRLFGVTMAERGVSQLVSVDLEAAEALRATG